MLRLSPCVRPNVVLSARPPVAGQQRCVVVRSIESKRPEGQSEELPSTSAGPDPNAASSSSTGGLTQEEIEKLAALRQAAKDKQEAANRGFLQTAIDEARLIEWPSPGQAVLQTFTVYLILIISTGLLFGMNVLLNQIFSKV